MQKIHIKRNPYIGTKFAGVQFFDSEQSELEFGKLPRHNPLLGYFNHSHKRVAINSNLAAKTKKGSLADKAEAPPVARSPCSSSDSEDCFVSYSDSDSDSVSDTDASSYTDANTYQQRATREQSSPVASNKKQRKFKRMCSNISTEAWLKVGSAMVRGKSSPNKSKTVIQSSYFN